MGTKIIVGKRCSGKTTDAIKESAETGRYILVPNRGMALNVAGYAKELGVHIPFPITVREWSKGVAPNVKRRGVIIDEGLIMLEQLLGTHIHMITISERPEVDEEDQKNNRDAFDATLYSLERTTDPWTKL